MNGEAQVAIEGEIQWLFNMILINTTKREEAYHAK